MVRLKFGFTLIELMVVISIIGLLASVVMANLSTSRLKAADARRIADFRNVKVALELYHNKYNQYPPSPNNYPPYNHQADFIAVANALVAEGFLSHVPQDPKDPINSYMAWDYASGPAGLIIVATLEGITPTTEGPNNSCRPFINNWCASNIASTYYCICNPH